MFRSLAIVSAALALVTGCLGIPGKDLTDALPSATFDKQGEYVIGVGDDIGIRVHGDSTLSGTYTVSAAGDLALPLVGFIHADGQTVKQLQTKLEAAILPFVQKPNVSSWVANRKSFQAYFCGEVARVGIVQLEDGMTFLQALSLAGGLTQFASGRLVLLRPTAAKTERYVVRYNDLLRGGDFYDKFRLGRGDTIVAE